MININQCQDVQFKHGHEHHTHTHTISNGQYQIRASLCVDKHFTTASSGEQLFPLKFQGQKREQVGQGFTFVFITLRNDALAIFMG